MKFLLISLLMGLLTATSAFAEEAEEATQATEQTDAEATPAADAEETAQVTDEQQEAEAEAEEPVETPAAPEESPVVDETPEMADPVTPPTERPAVAEEPREDRIIVTPEEPATRGTDIDLLALLEEEAPLFELQGYYRVRANYFYNVGLEKGDEDEEFINRFFRHRLRFEPTFNLSENVIFHAQLDAMDDQLWGANPGDVLSQTTADPFANMIVKRAWGEVTLPFARLDVGRMPSHWGMGLVANDGRGFRNIFGDAHGGSTADRIALATKPLGPDSNWIVAAIYDKMVADHPVALDGSPTPWVIGQPDRQASPENETAVDEIIGVLMYNTDPLKFGVYNVWRWESERGARAGRLDADGNLLDATSRVNITDAYFNMDLGLLYVETEHAWIYGNTNAIPIMQPVGEQGAAGQLFEVPFEEIDISQYGYAARLGINMFPYGAELEWGNATGDRQGFGDRVLRQFNFHPDYNVGLIMFQYANAAFAAEGLRDTLEGLDTLEQEGLIPAEEAQRLRDVSDLGLTRGRVGNAFYINPKVRYEMLDGDLRATLGYLWAQANAPRVLGALEGGEREFKNYGNEFDLAVDYDYTANLRLGFQAGWFRAGDYFTRQDPITAQLERADNAFLVQGRFTILF